MQNEHQLTEAESLQIITEMIGKVKSHCHESGSGAILWGSVIGLCSLMSFLQLYFHLSIGFDIWILSLVAIIPQLFIVWNNRRKRTIETYSEAAMNAVWSTFAIVLFGLILYLNLIGNISKQLMLNEQQFLLMKNTQTGELKEIVPFVLSSNSLFLLIYAFPTLATGFIRKFKPMILGGILCMLGFVASLFLNTTFDFLLQAIAVIVSWRIPGLILRNRYVKKQMGNV
jgi:uncharacterized protein with PQ loop repeat